MKVNNMASCREFLEQMPTHELDEMLRAELQKETIDDDLVRLLLRVLEEREREYPLEDDEAVAAAVEKYTAYVNSLKTTSAKPVRKWNGVLKVASVLLVVGLLLFAVPQAANAESFFEMLARWTESVFEFFSPGEVIEQPEYIFETDHAGLQQIYDTVVELGITDPVVPMWVPEGYVLNELEKHPVLENTAIDAHLSRNDDYISISYVDDEYHTSFIHEKDERNVEIIEINGNRLYVFSDEEKMLATWVVNKIECVLYSNCQEDEFIKILYSIYTAED